MNHGTMTKPDFSIVSTDTVSTKRGGNLAEWNPNYLIFKSDLLVGKIKITAYNHTAHKEAGDFSVKKDSPSPYVRDLYLMDDKIVLRRRDILVAYELH